VTELVNISEENSQIKRLSPLQLKQAVDETQKIKKRKLNPIAVGVQESNNDMEDQIEYAMKECSIDEPLVNRLRSLWATINGHPRLLRIKLKSPSKRPETY